MLLYLRGSAPFQPFLCFHNLSILSHASISSMLAIDGRSLGVRVSLHCNIRPPGCCSSANLKLIKGTFKLTCN